MQAREESAKLGRNIAAGDTLFLLIEKFGIVRFRRKVGFSTCVSRAAKLRSICFPQQ